MNDFEGRTKAERWPSGSAMHKQSRGRAIEARRFMVEEKDEFWCAWVGRSFAGRIAQSVEHSANNAAVQGSSPCMTILPPPSIHGGAAMLPFCHCWVMQCWLQCFDAIYFRSLFSLADVTRSGRALVRFSRQLDARHSGCRCQRCV